MNILFLQQQPKKKNSLIPTCFRFKEKKINVKKKQNKTWMDAVLPTYLVSRSTSFSWLSVSVCLSVPLTDVGGKTTISPSWQGIVKCIYFLKGKPVYKWFIKRPIQSHRFRKQKKEIKTNIFTFVRILN